MPKDTHADISTTDGLLEIKSSAFSKRVPAQFCKCGTKLWDNLDTNKIRIVGAHGTEADIIYTHIRVVCTCGQAYEQDSEVVKIIQQSHEYEKNGTSVIEAVSVKNPYLLLDKNERALIRNQLTDEEKKIFKTLLQYQDDWQGLQPNSRQLLKLSKDVNLTSEVICGYVEKIIKIIETVKPNFRSDLVVLRPIGGQKTQKNKFS